MAGNAKTRILVFGALNGWRGWIDVKKHVYDYDAIIFLGSLTTYLKGAYSTNEAANNLRELLEFRRSYPSKVFLMMGPEDVPFYQMEKRGWPPNTVQYIFSEASKFISPSTGDPLIHYALQAGETLVSTGGFCTEWLTKHLHRFVEIGFGSVYHTFAWFVNQTWRRAEFKDVLLNKDELIGHGEGVWESSCPIYTNMDQDSILCPIRGINQISGSATTSKISSYGSHKTGWFTFAPTSFRHDETFDKLKPSLLTTVI